ncbi:MAG: potassium/proton antiporter [Parvibaculaceae bacterium]
MGSIATINILLLSGSLLVLIGICSSLVANRFGTPLLLVFLGIGMLVGEDGPIGLPFNDYELTYFIGSLALAIILFDGGLRTKMSAFRSVLTPSVVLATVGVIITAALTGAAAFHLLDQLTPVEALLLGSTVASTDAAAVFFLLRSTGTQLQPRIGTLLEIESGTNDPVAMFLTIVLTELVIAGFWAPGWTVLVQLAQQATIGSAFGVAGGFLVVWLLNRVEMPGGLHPLFAVATAVLIYGVTATFDGSGLLATYLAGFVVANRPTRAYPSIVAFHDAATWLCQIGMFLVLGLLVTPSALMQYAVPGLAIALFLTFIARPAAIWLCLTPLGFTAKEMTFVSWVGLRGAVSIFLAAIPTLAQVPHAGLYFNIAFFIVLFSLLVQGWTINPMARWLGVTMRRPPPAVNRVELDIPGQVEQEMVGYPVASDSIVLGLTRLPAWARLVLVVRDEEILDAAAASVLQAGDYAYFLVPRERLPRLDRLFGASADLSRRQLGQFGELAINGDASLSEVAQLYELDVPLEEAGKTVAQFLESHIKGRPQPGNRLPLGRATLVVRGVEEGHVLRAGLQLEELIDTPIAQALARRARLDTLPGRARNVLGWLRGNVKG